MENDDLLYPGEVAKIFSVSVKTVGRWADLGYIESVRPHPRAHRRYRKSAVRAMIAKRLPTNN